jgi:hypothetical protein
VQVESDRIGAEASVGVTGDEPVEPSTLLGELPGDSSIAVALPGFGQRLEAFLALAEANAMNEFEPDPLEEFRREVGIDLQELAASFGDAAAFGRGTSVLDAGGGIVVEVTDPAQVADALDVARTVIERTGDRDTRVEKLAPQITGAEDGFAIRAPDAIEPFNVALGDDRLVLAYGDEATSDALDPTETLAEGGGLSEAESALGEEFAPTAYVNFGDILALAEQAGATQVDGFEDVQPYLETLGLFAAGIGGEPGRVNSRVILTLE